MASSAKDIQFKELKDTISQLNTTIRAQNDLILSLQQMLEERNAKNDEKDRIIANLQAQLEYFKQKLFGSSSKKRNNLPRQLNLFSDTVSEEESVPELIELNTSKKKRKPQLFEAWRCPLMMNAYYGLAYNPFDKQQIKEKDHFISRDFTEMTNRLNYLKDIRGIGVFTARPGMGKSYALRCFASSLNPSLYHMEYMCLSTISVADFYKQLCAMLGVSEKSGKPAMFAAVREQITYLYKEKRQPLFLAIDEAQYLNTGILNDTLRKPVHEALRQRITIHYNYAGLSDDEVAKYILHKLRLAGASETIINAALAAAHSYTQGNPRLIDNLMTDALTIGAQHDKEVIDAELIHDTVENQGLY